MMDKNPVAEKLREGWQQYSMVVQDAADLCSDGRKEILRLQEIVDRLPKTRDGEAVTPGMKLYLVQNGEVVEKTAAAIDMGGLVQFYGDDVWHDLDTFEVYATEKGIER